MWSTGKGFGKVGALFAGIECVIESVSGYFSIMLCVVDSRASASIVLKMTFIILLHRVSWLELSLRVIPVPKLRLVEA
jgi:hypothetical protein